MLGLLSWNIHVTDECKDVKVAVCGGGDLGIASVLLFIVVFEILSRVGIICLLLRLLEALLEVVQWLNLGSYLSGLERLRSSGLKLVSVHAAPQLLRYLVEVPRLLRVSLLLFNACPQRVDQACVRGVVLRQLC